MEQYILALDGLMDVQGAETRQQYEARIEAVVEEVLADAYAGMNMWDAGATQFTDTVQEFMEENNISRKPGAENGVRETNGPPTERYAADDVGTDYVDRSLIDDPQIYSYEFLTSQAPMKPVKLPVVTEVRDNQGRIDAAQIASKGIKNALSIGEERGEKVYVKNRYTGRELWVTTASIRHGLNGPANRVLTNARLGSVAGELLQNAIPINALHNTVDGLEGTYAMAGYAYDERGREFVAIITVEQRTGSVEDIDAYDVTHAISGRQKRGEQVDTKSQGVNPSMLASEISISNLLDLVKSTYRSILSTDVLDKLGKNKTEDGYYTNRVRYSVDDISEAEDGRQEEPARADIAGQNVRAYAKAHKQDLKQQEEAWRKRMREADRERLRGIKKPETESLPTRSLAFRSVQIPSFISTKRNSRPKAAFRCY